MRLSKEDMRALNAANNPGGERPGCIWSVLVCLIAWIILLLAIW